MISRKIRVLTIGHSYVIALNRAVAREVARHPDFEVTVAAPSFFHGDLRDLELEPEPEDSPLRLVGLALAGHAGFMSFTTTPGCCAGSFAKTSSTWSTPGKNRMSMPATRLPGVWPACRSLSRFIPARTSKNASRHRSAPSKRATLARAQGWIAAGGLVYDAMRTRGYPAERGRVLALAVDTAVFEPLDESRRASVQGKLGLRPPVIGYTGRLTQEKGLYVLMRAMEQVGERPWSLLLLGSGPEEEKVRDWAKARGWADRVRILLARHDEVPSYLGAMDMLVAPSQTTRHWKEQLGRMLIEAFACGVPVIGSDSGEIPYVISDAGRVVGEKDVVGWAAAIVELLDRPDLCAD